MKRTFKVEKLPLDNLINLLIELYESGIDYVDLSSDNEDPGQDKLIIQTKDAYINPKWKNGNRPPPNDSDDDDDDDDNLPTKPSPTIETRKLTDDDIEKLL